MLMTCPGLILLGSVICGLAWISAVRLTPKRCAIEYMVSPERTVYVTYDHLTHLLSGTKNLKPTIHYMLGLENGLWKYKAVTCTDTSPGLKVILYKAGSWDIMLMD